MRKQNNKQFLKKRGVLSLRTKIFLLSSLPLFLITAINTYAIELKRLHYLWLSLAIAVGSIVAFIKFAAKESEV